MFDNLVILNLQYFKRDSYISVICQALIAQGKAEKQMRLPTQRLLGVKIWKTAFWGTTKEKSSYESSCLFQCKDSSFIKKDIFVYTIEKRVDKRQLVKRKLNEKYVYYGIMLFVVAIFLVIMFSERKKAGSAI